MGLDMKENIEMGKSTDLVNLYGQTEANMKDNFMIITLMAKECIDGPMEECMMGHGSIIKWKDKALSHGLIIEAMWEVMLMIKSKGMEFSSGQMGEDTKEIGLMGSNMGKVFILHHKE